MKTKKDNIYYGLKGWEQLKGNIKDVIDLVLEEATARDYIGSNFDFIADLVTFPIRILEYKTRKIDKVSFANDIVERLLESLDEEYGDPDGDYTEPTEEMKIEARKFVNAVVDDYIPWGCEPTGKVIEYTREQVKQMF